jgi:hypothetical protein
MLNNIALRSATDAARSPSWRDALEGSVVASRKESKRWQFTFSTASTSLRIPVGIPREAAGETLLTDEDISRGFLDFS